MISARASATRRPSISPRRMGRSPAASSPPRAGSRASWPGGSSRRWCAWVCSGAWGKVGAPGTACP